MDSAVDTLLEMISTRKGARFANIVYKSESTGEIARFQLILGAKTETLYKKDIEAITDVLKGTLTDAEREAVTKILDSRMESLEKGVGHNSRYVHSPEKADTYAIVDSMPGIKLHKCTGTVYVTALSQHKTVLVAATTPRKPVKHRTEVTAAKARFERELPSSRLRQFVLKHITRAALNGDVLEIDGVDIPG